MKEFNSFSVDNSDSWNTENKDHFSIILSVGSSEVRDIQGIAEIKQNSNVLRENIFFRTCILIVIIHIYMQINKIS